MIYIAFPLPPKKDRARAQWHKPNMDKPNLMCPRWPALLPKLQSLDHLLSSITWRERFAATCLSHRSMDERNSILKWGADHLGGLRWQVISSFCRAVSSASVSVSLLTTMFCSHVFYFCIKLIATLATLATHLNSQSYDCFRFGRPWLNSNHFYY